MGKDFWFGFMDNNDTLLGSEMLKVFVSSPRNCTVTLENPNTGYSVTTNVQPNSVTTLNVPQAQAFSSSSCIVEDKGFHLYATDTVSVYKSIQGLYNYEVANIYPTEVLRDKCVLQSYPSDRWGSEFLIVATEDSTWADVCITSPTSTGLSAGSTISVFLSSTGKSYQVDTISMFEGDSLLWIDGITYYSATNLPSVILHTVHGCDSIVRLHLKCISRPQLEDSSSLWVPNVFTPDESTNNVFKIYCHDIEYMHVFIFTRCGLYLTDFDAMTQGWNGSANGLPCKNETYVYLIEYSTKKILKT